ncbi:MAG: hypothetical protein L6R41_004811 [Letrouitia leprolyta]|nr:MAG: hypothetical protein L6R41_004811 [Letrouitia leprolyta]
MPMLWPPDTEPEDEDDWELDVEDIGDPQWWQHIAGFVIICFPPVSWILLGCRVTGCVGGETVFYPELGPAKKFSGKENDGTKPIVVELEVGMALLHKHGQDCLLHEGREVTQGEKWVIRSDICVKR